MAFEYTSEQKAIMPRLASANINPDSFLATDYLNHFNEIVMLLEMVPDMPELAEDAYDWEPKSYQQHFLDSGFQAKELAIQAYELAPANVRAAFDAICGQINQTVNGTIAGLKAVNVVERGFTPQAQELVRNRVEAVQDMLMQLNKVIHGNVDASIATTVTEAAEDTQTQADIDKLFD